MVARLTEWLSVVFEEVGGAEFRLTVEADEVFVMPLPIEGRDDLEKRRKHFENDLKERVLELRAGREAISIQPVSYTHLTLPTILLV